MLRERLSIDISDFMRYLAAHDGAEGSLPPLTDLSRELGISVAALREQLEVARALGLVEVRPRTGTRRLAYSFAPANAWRPPASPLPRRWPGPNARSVPEALVLFLYASHSTESRVCTGT